MDITIHAQQVMIANSNEALDVWQAILTTLVAIQADTSELKARVASLADAQEPKELQP